MSSTPRKAFLSRLLRQPVLWVMLALLGTGLTLSVKRQRALDALMRTLPVVSVAEDGTVRIDGRELVVTADGLPPRALELIEGGPPEEMRRTTDMETRDELDNAFTRWWRYPRTGLTFTTIRQVAEHRFKFDAELGLHGGAASFRGTLEFRGRRWRLAEEMPLDWRDFSAVTRRGDEVRRPAHYMALHNDARDVTLLVFFEKADWLRRERVTGVRITHSLDFGVMRLGR